MTYYERAAKLMEAEVGDDLVALDPEAGTCFGFNSVAASVWRLLEDRKSFEQLEAELAAEYDVDSAQCRTDLEELLDSMVAQGLVRTVS